MSNIIEDFYYGNIEPQEVSSELTPKLKKKLSNLAEKEEQLDDRNSWNDEYMNRVMVKVLSNFSHERIDHLKEVVRYLRPVAKTVAPKKEQTSHQTYSTTQKGSYEEEKRRCQERGDYLGAKIGAGAVVGAAVGGVIASVADAPVVGVIGGVTTTLIVNGGKR